MRFLSRYHSGNAETQQRFAPNTYQENDNANSPGEAGDDRDRRAISPFPSGSTCRVRVAAPKSRRSPFLLQLSFP
jgi:hypothetical protein